MREAAMIGLIELVLLCGEVSAGMTPITGFPEFVAVGYVDGVQFVVYDSDRREVIPRGSGWWRARGLSPGNRRRSSHRRGTNVSKIIFRPSCIEPTSQELPPIVSFTRLGDSNRLSCAVTGFYPQAIEVNLWRNRVVIDETLSSGILPNHDSTYQIRKWVEFDPEDQAEYSCRVEHSGMKETLVVIYASDKGDSRTISSAGS
ncbi:uncharacterized protein LOC144496947 isoform X2 [Mustelus asterias]